MIYAILFRPQCPNIYGVGVKTAEELQRIGITIVRHIYDNRQKIIGLLGNHGWQIIKLADGIDNRKVTTYSELSFDIRMKNLYCRTVTLKLTYNRLPAPRAEKQPTGRRPFMKRLPPCLIKSRSGLSVLWVYT